MRQNQVLANKQHDRQSLKDLQDAMLSCSSHIDLPVSHRFINGVYAREIFYSLRCIGCWSNHKTEHWYYYFSGCVEEVVTGQMLLWRSIKA